MPLKLSSIQRLAKAHGIQLSYLAATGEERTAPPETLVNLLEILGLGRVNEQEAAKLLREHKARAASQPLDPVHVLWDGRTPGLKITLPTKSARLSLILENGEKQTLPPPAEAALGRDGQARLSLPRLPIGYHTLLLESGADRHEALLISAPTRVYQDPSGEREWGFFAPLYAVHTRESWGAGSFTDWKRFTGFAADRGARVVASLPILASFLGEDPFEPSPYSPASRLFWNEFYVDVQAIPEYATSSRARRLTRARGFQETLQTLRASDLVDYREGMRLRRRVLETLAQEFFGNSNPARRREFERFLKRRPEIKEYARFRAAVEKLGPSWPAWEGRARDGVLRPHDFAAVTADYFAYVQWLAHEQLDHLLDTCRDRGVKFYLDLPLGVNPAGYDAWRYRDFFAQGANAGAPPDAFFTKGQDWGFRPLHPERMRQLRYSHVIDFLRFQMQHTGMLRLDHVMGLNRLYWVPQGRPPSEGAYVQYPADELYAILALESHRHQCVLVGENLGTVPRETERAMQQHRVRRMYVMQFENAGKQGLAGPSASEVASHGTHDMPTFAGHWKGRDITDRLKLGLLDHAEAKRERAHREQWKAGIIRSLRRLGFLPKGSATPREVFQAMLRFLARSPAPTVLVNLEDLWLEERPQNVPGTSTERPNWRRKARLSLEDIESSPAIARLCDVLTKGIQGDTTDA